MRYKSSQFFYTDVINMNLPSVLTPPSIYHGCSARKTFWEEKFTPVNMKKCGCHNVRKHREVNNGDHDIALDIYLKSGNMEKMKSHRLNQRIIWEYQVRG